MSVLLSGDEQRMVATLAKEDALSKSDAVRMAIRRAYGAIAERPAKDITGREGGPGGHVSPGFKQPSAYDDLYLPVEVRLPGPGKATFDDHGRPRRCAATWKSFRCYHLSGHLGWHEDKVAACLPPDSKNDGSRPLGVRWKQ